MLEHLQSEKDSLSSQSKEAQLGLKGELESVQGELASKDDKLSQLQKSFKTLQGQLKSTETQGVKQVEALVT